MTSVWRYLAAIVILAGGLVISLLYAPAPANTRIHELISSLPKDFKGWQFVNDIEMSADTYEALDPAGLIFREYRNSSGSPLELVVVYHQNSRWGAHAPVLCYTSQGWQVVENPRIRKTLLDGKPFEVNQFEVKKHDFDEIVYYYWFSSNRKITASRNQQMLDMVINGLLFGYTESGFVRVSMHASDFTRNMVLKNMDDFVAAFTPVLEKSLWGSPSSNRTPS